MTRSHATYSYDPTEVELKAFNLSLEENMEELQELIPSFYSENSRNFAQSLCDFYSDRGYLSEKQLFHACKMWLEVSSKNPAKAEKLPPKQPAELAAPRVHVDGSKIEALLDKAAKSGLKFPKIRYRITADIVITFYITGEKSKFPGHIGVCTGEQESWNQICILHRKGPPIWSKFSFDKPELQQKIKQIAEGGIESFTVNGKQTGHCCFCGLLLENKSSVHHGYGPICADNYGLPWGDVPAEKLDIGLPE